MSIIIKNHGWRKLLFFRGAFGRPNEVSIWTKLPPMHPPRYVKIDVIQRRLSGKHLHQSLILWYRLRFIHDGGEMIDDGLLQSVFLFNRKLDDECAYKPGKS